jgi:hypothetical protein
MTPALPLASAARPPSPQPPLLSRSHPALQSDKESAPPFRNPRPEPLPPNAAGFSRLSYGEPGCLPDDFQRRAVGPRSFACSTPAPDLQENALALRPTSRYSANMSDLVRTTGTAATVISILGITTIRLPAGPGVRG